MGHVRVQTLSCLQSINVLRVASDQFSRVSEGLYEAMSRCGFLDFFVDGFAEGCDESIEDWGADRILPHLGIEKVFAFDVVGHRDRYRL